MRTNSFYIFLSYLSLVIMFCYSCNQQNELNKKNATLSGIPHLQKNGNSVQLVVDNKPFIMISGELHNSSSSSVEYLAPLWPKLKAMNLNSVIASVAWEQFEPEEGVYDFTLVDEIISKAKENDLKLCLIWFATWKNGRSTYTPMWVKKDTKRFFRVKSKNGKNTEVISPLCENAMKADAKAFGILMNHIKKVDKLNTVIMMQIENEVGIQFQDFDYSTGSLKHFEQEVPFQFISYLNKNKNQLTQKLDSVWRINGYKSKGTWKEVFGNNPYSKEFFLAWHYAFYINEVCKTGKKEHSLPMYVNAWLEGPNEMPGDYLNGGPVASVMDIYKAAAENIDIIAPDIYRPNFKEITGLYHRKDNALLIPESEHTASRAFYAFAQHDAICYSPFGIEDDTLNHALIQAYKTLDELKPLLIKYQGTGKMAGILAEGNEKECTVELGDYAIKAVYKNSNGQSRAETKDESFGLIIQTSENEFVVSGMNMWLFFSAKDTTKTGHIAQVWEGGFDGGKWKSIRMLNGDETIAHFVVKVMGKPYATKVDNTIYSPDRMITTPGIYKVLTYMRD